MKKLVVMLLLLLGILSIADDLKTGQETAITNHNDIYALKEHKVEPGETVLSITEELHGGMIPGADIPKLLDDFSLHNSNISPYELTVGKTYLFPLYRKKQKG